MVCNMERRAFTGVEACSTATSSYNKLFFKDEVVLSPKPECKFQEELRGKEFEFRAKSGDCNYEFQEIVSGKRGHYHVYGWDQIVIRKQ